MRSLDWRQDKDYLDYIDSGESAAVYIVKNIVKSLDTKNMWVDVVSINTYYKRGSGNIAFNWIIVELFPRKIKPKYDTDPDYNRYLISNSLGVWILTGMVCSPAPALTSICCSFLWKSPQQNFGNG